MADSQRERRKSRKSLVQVDQNLGLIRRNVDSEVETCNDPDANVIKEMKGQNVLLQQEVSNYRKIDILSEPTGQVTCDTVPASIEELLAQEKQLDADLKTQSVDVRRANALEKHCQRKNAEKENYRKLLLAHETDYQLYEAQF